MAENPYLPDLNVINNYVDERNRKQQAPYSSGNNGLADIASILGSFSSGKKADRIVEGNFVGDRDKMMLDRESIIAKIMLDAQDARNRNESDALRKLQQSSYIAGGGFKPTPQNITLRGNTTSLPSFGFGPQGASKESMTGAASLRDQMLGRLQNQESYVPKFDYVPSDITDFSKPGLLENIGSYGGAGAGILSAIPGIASKIPWIRSLFGSGGGAAATEAGATGGSGAGTAALAGAGNVLGRYVLPGVGAAAGIYGLTQDRGLKTNVMNGLSTGASVGTMIMPGVGTAVGAGIGAGVGALRGIGGPNEEEKQARTASSTYIGQLTSSATPTQRAEASASGWENSEQALAQIVLRDKLAQQGKPPALAGQLLGQLLDATSKSKNPQAVSQAASLITQALQG